MDLVLIIAAICGVFFVVRWIGEKGAYLYHRNPAIRMCSDCGQIQHAYCAHMSEWDNDWWVPVGETLNPECKCHKDVR